jgi:hypothetical protein
MATHDDKLRQLPPVLRAPVARWFERLASEHVAKPIPENVLPDLVRVLAVSEFAGNTLLREWDTGSPTLTRRQALRRWSNSRTKSRRVMRTSARSAPD